ncbi:hypothetical protein EDD18DRAFT_1161053 [Armillaria luteobubalina]|uniref:Cytochrome c oxidase-assembly factor COX23, mitochondrial n=1 Tax=Armillaria luteobubalina TaxID=153913 RepID=A0AA39Q712_9AGAR|nr:hypothetical protein EDD18DRAFT_1161053 [Armillaria luteobubalina]
MAKEEISAPQDNAKPLNYREQFQGRHAPSKFIDPCEAASKASLSCLSRNNYDRDACQAYFQAYRDCKAAWLQQRRDDRKAGRPTS